jgi:CRISPR-associated protein Cst1
MTYEFASRFLKRNRRAIQTAQQSGERKMPEHPHRAGTVVVETLLGMESERQQAAAEGPSVSITAYHLSNSGQGVALDIYHLPLEITAFLRSAMSASHRVAWDALSRRGWEVSAARRTGKPDTFVPHYNVLYEDLFHLPEEAASFIRRYFLRMPGRRARPGDPRVSYSVREDVGLISWSLTDLFLRKVVKMNPDRVQQIRDLGDSLAQYIASENDRRFFHTLLTTRRYDDLRAALIRVSVARMKRGQPPLIAFDPYIQVFEQGEDLPYSDWRLARDLVLIRTIEQLHQKGWIQAHVEEIPEPEAAEDETT